MIQKIFAAIGILVVVSLGSFALGLAIPYFIDPFKDEGFGTRNVREWLDARIVDEDFEADEDGLDRMSEENNEESRNGGSDIDADSLSNIGNISFSGDAIDLLGMDWNDAWEFMGIGSTSSVSTTVNNQDVTIHAIFGNTLTDDERAHLNSRDIENAAIGVTASMTNSLNDPDADYRIGKVNIGRGSGMSFKGVEIGETLVEAEHRLNIAASRIRGGVVAYIDETDGEVSSILFLGHTFHSVEQVEEYILIGSGAEPNINLSWTLEIDNHFYEVTITSNDFYTVDSMSILMYDNEAINMGLTRDPFHVDEQLPGNIHQSHTIIGLIGLESQYWT